MGSLSRWAVFLAVFLCVYGSLHLYLLVKVRRAYHVEGWGHILLVMVLLFLMLTPIQARLLDVQGHALSALMMTWIGYLWMGYVFIFVCLAIPLDAYHSAAATLQQLFNADWTHIMLSRRQNMALTAAVTAGLMLYGAYAAFQVPVNHITLPSTKVPEAAGRVRIVQISDLHLGPMTYPGRLGPILNAIREARPDVLVSTGDLVDGPLRDGATVAGLLRALPAPMGKFAVIGNHEFYLGIQSATQFTQSAGFTLLRGESVQLADGIVLAGVDDPTGGRPQGATENALLAAVPDDHFAILLKHRPVLEHADDRRFDLQLSGHTPKGQIFPFGLLIGLVYPLKAGWHPSGPGSHIHVNRGTGTWGPPIRILAPPEITVIDLVSKQR
jgi:uncharacterized protein